MNVERTNNGWQSMLLVRGEPYLSGAVQAWNRLHYEADPWRVIRHDDCLIINSLVSCEDQLEALDRAKRGHNVHIAVLRYTLWSG